MSDAGTEHSIFKVLSHPIRSKIVEAIYENSTLSYTDILSILKIDTGQLNFHLRNMTELYKRDSNGNYVLTSTGKFAYYMLLEAKKRLGEEAGPLEPQAPFIKRLFATLLDYLLFIGSPLVAMMLITIWIPFTHLDPMLITLFFHLLFFFTFVAFMSMETYNGQTIGKFVTKIKVIKEDGRKIDMTEGIFRNIAKVYFLPLDFILGVLLYKNEGYIRFSDKFLKLRVVDVSVSMITIPEDASSQDVKKMAGRR